MRMGGSLSSVDAHRLRLRTRGQAVGGLTEDPLSVRRPRASNVQDGMPSSSLHRLRRCPRESWRRVIRDHRGRAALRYDDPFAVRRPSRRVLKRRMPSRSLTNRTGCRQWTATARSRTSPAALPLIRERAAVRRIGQRPQRVRRATSRSRRRSRSDVRTGRRGFAPRSRDVPDAVGDERELIAGWRPGGRELVARGREDRSTSATVRRDERRDRNRLRPTRRRSPGRSAQHGGIGFVGVRGGQLRFACRTRCRPSTGGDCRQAQSGMRHDDVAVVGHPAEGREVRRLWSSPSSRSRAGSRSSAG